MAVLVTSLKEINPNIGAKVIIELASPKRKVALELLGFIEGKTLILSAPKKKTSYAANKVEGSNVKVHIMLQGCICTFVTRITHVMIEPFAYWHIAYPKQINISKTRKEESVSVNLPVAIETQDKSLNQHAEIPNIVFCSRLSLIGATIESPVSLTGFSLEYFITLKIKIANIDQLLLTPVLLKSSKQVEPGVFVNEFEFQELTDESKVLIAAFMYKEMLVEHGYIND